MERKELQKVEKTPIQILEEGFSLAVKQRELLEEWIKSRLKAGIHYFYLKEQDKPVLAQPGAQLIILAHGFKPEFEIVSQPEKPSIVRNNEFYIISVKCKLYLNEDFKGTGLGSASSLIYSKKKNALIPRQSDADKTHNATLKIAMKRALVAATLNATAAGEFFTQDLEEEREVIEEENKENLESFLKKANPKIRSFYPWLKKNVKTLKDLKNYSQSKKIQEKWLKLGPEIFDQWSNLITLYAETLEKGKKNEQNG